MPITIREIKEHYDYYGLHDMSSMSTAEYQQILANGALFWIDHHGFLRSTFSDEILATNGVQFDVLLSHLQELRSKVDS
ncbi:hypothetical protein JGT96_15065 [Enterobacter hormaechei]|uniref:Uncharacterized protein n=2 Tax=Enterobacter cloacae complex TaxID=354276 RepID=A0ABX9EZ33_9ENTR|nr:MULTISPECIES: hypothetical protein [Enterobacteriaceae]MBS7118706.1 hypothetical protein [Enterobacter cloacae]KJP14034.1 hypothetical protein SR74_22090 [Enterobacter asburiae]KLW86854.1 hypothetical protein SP99_04032 [Enterobacter sp. BIDMC92]KOQ91364.1 hypothetical protein ABW49_15585 [Enterobacter asburiae]KUQ47138.1 hypothetical protein AWI16_06160 [Enterobacter ludwigii]